MKWHIALGTVGIVAVIAVLSFVAITEQDRMASFTRSYHSRSIEVGALIFENNCRTCHGTQGRGVDGLGPSVNTADLFNGERLRSFGFTGTVEDYLRGVISAGRPVPSAGTNYAQRMPTWSEENGGPLRNDQIDSLVAFIMNWEEDALAGDGGVSPPIGDFIGTDITVELPPGDAGRGQDLSDGVFGCYSCHILTTVGPAWAAEGSVPGIGERAADRIGQGDYGGTASTPEQYLIESVLLPDNYVVEGYQSGIMLGNYGERITVQEMADLLAFMLSIE